MRNVPVARVGLLITLAAALAGCANPVGAPIAACGPDVEPKGIAAPTAGVRDPEPIGIECYRLVRDSRIEVVFSVPAGDDACRAVSLVEPVEGADAVSVEVWLGTAVGPSVGFCAVEGERWAVLLELNRALGERQVLDPTRPSP